MSPPKSLLNRSWGPSALSLEMSRSNAQSLGAASGFTIMSDSHAVGQPTPGKVYPKNLKNLISLDMLHPGTFL